MPQEYDKSFWAKTQPEDAELANARQNQQSQWATHPESRNPGIQ